MSNSFDPDQARHFVGPDLGPNFLQMLSADNGNRQWVQELSLHINNVKWFVFEHMVYKKGEDMFILSIK